MLKGLITHTNAHLHVSDMLPYEVDVVPMVFFFFLSWQRKVYTLKISSYKTSEIYVDFVHVSASSKYNFQSNVITLICVTYKK
jgi:hypothetical protein